MKHPEGRLMAIQQQIHFAETASSSFDMMPEYLLACLSKVGLKLTTDENEIAVDAALIVERMNMAKPLKVVKNEHNSTKG